MTLSTTALVPLPTRVPYVTAAIGAAGGLFKATPEDFLVEEIPAYLPSGSGEHFLVWIEKRQRSTLEVAKALAKHVGCAERDVSWAGQKDRQAVSRQWLCAPARFAAPKISTFQLDGVNVLAFAPHQNKLKTGHLRGNRFHLTLRDVRDTVAAREAFEMLCQHGAPNAYGAQRFGRHLDNAHKGKAILMSGGRHSDRFERKLFLSAYQSELFNRVLARRINAGTWRAALRGDVLKKPTGGEFVSEMPDIDTERVSRFEVSPTGPVFGPDMRQPAGEVAALESQILAEEGIEHSLFLAGKGETMGARRALRMTLDNPEFEQSGSTVKLSFSLPSGSYATVVLREILKSETTPLHEE
jgi:tRNA pseudouridine13 synthase